MPELLDQRRRKNMKYNIFCQECGEMMEYDGTENFPLWFLENEPPGISNSERIKFYSYKCTTCGSIQYFEFGVEPPPEYLRPPIRTIIKVIQGGKPQ